MQQYALDASQRISRSIGFALAPYVRIYQHTSAYVSIRQQTWTRRRGSRDRSALRLPHTSEYISIRQHTLAYVSKPGRVAEDLEIDRLCACPIRQNTSAYVSIRQRTSAHLDASQRISRSIAFALACGRSTLTPPFSLTCDKNTSAYVSIRQHTSAYVRGARLRLPCRRRAHTLLA
jgi:hypothetical protein